MSKVVRTGRRPKVQRGFVRRSQDEETEAHAVPRAVDAGTTDYHRLLAANLDSTHLAGNLSAASGGERAHIVGGLQQAVGNRAVQLLLQRQELPTKSASTARASSLVSVWIDGPVAGVKRTLVYVPAAIGSPPPSHSVEVLLHFHGFGATAGRYEKFDKIARTLESSERPMVAVIPQYDFLFKDVVVKTPQGPRPRKKCVGDSLSKSGFASDAFLTAVFKQLQSSGTVPKRINPGPVTLSGHSGAGRPIGEMLRRDLKLRKEMEKGPPTSKPLLPAAMPAVVLFDAINGEGQLAAVQQWVLQQLDGERAILNGFRSTAEQLSYLRTSRRFRAYYSLAGQLYPPLHAKLKQAIDTWFDKHAGAAGLLDADTKRKGTVYDGLRQNYAVVPSAPGVGHQTVVGANLPSALQQTEGSAATEKTPASTGVQRQAEAGAVGKQGRKKFKHKLSSAEETLVEARELKKIKRGKKEVTVPGRLAIRESPHTYVRGVLKLAGIANPEAWLANFEKITFLGRSVSDLVHADLAEHLRAREAQLAKTFGGGDAKKAGDALGLKERILGSRDAPTGKAHYSMHLFGLAIDLNYTTNPYIALSENALKVSQAVFKRVGQLTLGAPMTFKKGMSHEQLADLDSVLQDYFSYLDDQESLKVSLETAKAKPWKGLSVAQATKIIRQDLKDCAAAWQRSKAMGQIKTGGFMDLQADLVKGLDLDWGGTYGDIMHFDMRNKGVGRQVHEAIARYKSQKEKEAERLYAELQKKKEKEEQGKQLSK